MLLLGASFVLPPNASASPGSGAPVFQLSSSLQLSLLAWPPSQVRVTPVDAGSGVTCVEEDCDCEFPCRCRFSLFLFFRCFSFSRSRSSFWCSFFLRSSSVSSLPSPLSPPLSLLLSTSSSLSFFFFVPSPCLSLKNAFLRRVRKLSPLSDCRDA